MTRSITVGRRGLALLSGVAAVAAFGLGGCGAGQNAETANKRSSVPGNELEIPLRSTDDFGRDGRSPMTHRAHGPDLPRAH